MEFLMNKFTSAVKAFLADENGMTAIEYALLAALIGGALVAIAGPSGTFRTALSTAFNQIGNSLQSKATF
jgi:pilus assembly protein Flp/PilA